MKKGILSIKDIKQEFLANVSSGSAKAVMEGIDDDLLNIVDITELKNNQINMQVNLAELTKESVLIKIAFAFSYGDEEDILTKDSYILMGEYSSVITQRVDNKERIDTQKLLKDKTILNPILGKISKCIFDATSETSLYPFGVDLQEKLRNGSLQDDSTK